MALTGSRTWSSRNVEFLKFAPPGLDYRRNIVLESDWFGLLPVDEGATVTKKIARKGQLLVKDTATSKYRPFGRTLVNGATAVGTTVVVDDASPFVAGQVIAVGGQANRTIASVNYATNTITLTAALAASAADNAAVVADSDAGTIVAGNMVVLGYEVDLTYGDKPGAGYVFDCIFNPAGLYGYAGNETQVKAAMPTCHFDE